MSKMTNEQRLRDERNQARHEAQSLREALQVCKGDRARHADAAIRLAAERDSALEELALLRPLAHAVSDWILAEGGSSEPMLAARRRARDTIAAWRAFQRERGGKV